MTQDDFENRPEGIFKVEEENLKEFENRKKYRALTPEVIGSIPDDELEQAVVDYVYQKVGDDNYQDPEMLDKLPVGPRVIYVTWWVEAEVNNGGFNQYFWNWPDEWFARKAAEAFSLIGAAGHAELMNRVIETYQKERTRLEDYYDSGTLDSFSESYNDNPLNELDDEFYGLGEDLSEMRVKFIRKHPGLFSD